MSRSKSPRVSLLLDNNNNNNKENVSDISNINSKKT